MGNEKKKIIIVGGGISGLTAGIFGQLNGFDTTIIEKNACVGGLCTGWNRNGRYIDGCVHWLTGSKDDSFLSKDWKTIGAFSTQDDLIYIPSWGSFEFEGKTVTFWRDLDRAEKEWKEISKEDEKLIKWFFNTIRKINKFELPLIAPSILLPLGLFLRSGFYFLKNGLFLYKLFFSSCEEFAAKFKSPALRFALTHAQPGAGNLYSMMFSYATVALGNGGIPKGGSKAMSERIKDKYLSLNGNLMLNSEVISINTASNKAVGVTLKNGEQISGDYVITACDAPYAISTLIKNNDVAKRIIKRNDKPLEYPAPSAIFLNFEVENMPDINIPFSFPIDKWNVSGKDIDHLTIRHMNYDPVYKVGNKTIVQVMIDLASEHYKYWKNLYLNKAEYNKAKNEISSKVISLIEARFPEVKGKISCLDVATPVTYNHYVNATYGNYMGFLFTKGKFPIMYSGKAKKIKNLYISGQYVQCPGGLPLALASGKFAIQWILLHELNKKRFFKTINITKHFNPKY